MMTTTLMMTGLGIQTENQVCWDLFPLLQGIYWLPFLVFKFNEHAAFHKYDEF